MFIDSSKCVKCKKCVPYCPRNAILEKDGVMTIDMDLCVECGVCKNWAKCPRDAIYNVHLEAPRAYRKAFSDPFGMRTLRSSTWDVGRKRSKPMM